jgi:serine/threonine-protein kinase
MSQPSWTDGDRPPLSLDQLVDQFCSPFEAALNSGRTPRIEDHLAAAVGADRAAVLQELVLLEVHHRRRRGESPQASEYLTRFPELDPGWLAKVLASSDSGSSGNLHEQATEPYPLPCLSQSFQPDLNTTGAAERYTVTRLHAKGGIGQVWLARDVILGREVALKELQPEYAGHPEAWARFLAEAKVTGQLEHPGVVPVYELSQRPENKQPFYAMRFVRGRTLSEACKSFHQKRRASQAGPLDLIALLNAFVAVCQSVAYAHSRGVIHRDLKGGNVVLGEFGEAIVLDWGLAKVVGEGSQPDGEPNAVTPPATLPPVSLHDTGRRHDTVQGQVLGTPAYMSPEQAAGRTDEIDERSDVYGLGTLLYEILTGQAPFLGADSHEVLQKVIEEPPLPPRAADATTPPALEAICLKALAKRPADRYPSAADLAKDVQRYLADEPVAAYRDPLGARLGRWARRHRTLVTSTAATLFVALSGSMLAASLLSAANQRLSAANQQERKAKDAAQSNYQLARDAVDEYLVKISKDRRLYAAGLGKLRKDLLEEAGKFYTRFINERGEEPSLEFELGHAYLELAVVRAETSAVTEAITLFQKGLDIVGRLAHIDPGELKYQKELTSGYHRLATLYLAAGNTTEAERAFQQASELLRQVLEAEPADRAHKLLWASLRHNVAILAERRGDIAEAVKSTLEVVGELTQAVEADPGASDIRFGLANSLNSLAALHQSRTGKLGESEKYYDLALCHHQELLKRDPEDRDYRESLARTYVNRGMLYWYLGKRADALQASQRAVEMARQLAEQHREVPEYQGDLAAYLTTLGTLYQETDKLDEAEQTHRRALSVHKQLAEAHPEIPEYQSRFASSHGELGACYLKLGKLAEAERELSQAIELNQRLAEAHADLLSHQLNLGTNYRFLGDVRLAAGDPEGALRWYGQTAERLQTILKKSPQYVDAKRELQVTYEGQARAFSRLGRHADALRAWDQALAFPEGPHGDLCRADRAVTRVRAGQYEQAVAEAAAMAAREDISPLVLYEVACVYALASEVRSLGTRQKDDYALRAVQILRKALDKGNFTKKHLLTDKDLDALRDRADFQQLLAEFRDKGPSQ